MPVIVPMPFRISPSVEVFASVSPLASTYAGKICSRPSFGRSTGRVLHRRVRVTSTLGDIWAIKGLVAE